MATIQTSIVMADNITATLNNITGALNLIVTAFQDVQSASSNDIDINAFDGIREQINAATIATKAFQSELDSIKPPTVPIEVTPVHISQNNNDIFQNTGTNRLSIEMNSLKATLDDISTKQQRIGEQALSMDLLSPDALSDISATNQRIEELGQKIAALQEIDISLMDDDGITRINAEFESIQGNMSNLINLQESINATIGEGDFSRLNNAYKELNHIAEQVEQTGQRIGRQALTMQILSPSAVSDLESMNSRLQSLQSQIEQMQNARIQIVGISRANAEMEGLRQQLNEALQTQEDLNNALNNMDATAANSAYSRLNDIVDGVERNIKDNIAEQQRFNEELRNGSNAADRLQNKIMGMAAAYLSVQSVKNVLDLSDTSAQTAARLKLIVDDGGSVEALQNKIFLSAERARADYQMTADVISKLGMQAGNAFNSNDELIAFAEQLNKTFKIAGTDASGIASTMYNLTQALSSGVLRGQDLNSVFSNAQPIIQNIAEYLGVSAGEIRDMAADGQLSAEVVKNAMLAAAKTTNEQFKNIPKTFGEIATSIKNNALMAFQPILDRLNEIANSQAFQTFVDNVINGMVVVANVVMWVFGLISDFATFTSNNWDMIAPVIYAVVVALAIYYGWQLAANGVALIGKGLHIAGAIASMAYAAATGTLTAAKSAEIAAQWGLNAALYACPIVWIIILIIALIAIIYIVIAAMNKFAGTSVSATGIVFGAFAVLGAFLWNLFLGLLELILGVINYLINPFIEFANFIGNVFKNPISSIIYLFQGMADNVLGILQKIASALDFVFGANMAGTIASWRSGLKSMADKAVAKYAPNENYQKVMNNLDLSVDSLGLKRWEYGKAWETGYQAGENIEDTISNFDPTSALDYDAPLVGDYANSSFGYDPEGVAQNVAGINSNTSDIKAATEEDLKYLRDIAEREAINRFTIAEVQVDFGGVTNNVNSSMDLDGVIDYLNDGVREAIEITAEGVYA